MAQHDLFVAALSRAGVQHDALLAVEVAANGSGLGDPIEARSVAKALLPAGRPVPLILHNFKGYMGHGEHASGVVALAKVVAEVTRSTASPNAQLRVVNRLVYMALEGKTGVLPSQQTRRTAPLLREAVADGGGPLASDITCGDATCHGISSFGYSGTIVHMLAANSTQAPPIPDTSPRFRRKRIPLPTDKVPSTGDNGRLTPKSAYQPKSAAPFDRLKRWIMQSSGSSPFAFGAKPSASDQPPALLVEVLHTAASRSGPMIALMHSVTGTVNFYNGLRGRVLTGRGRHIVGLHRGTSAVAQPQPFQELAESYADVLLEVDSSFDLVGFSNGTGNILWLSRVLRRRGGTVKRLVFIDPGPPDEPTASPTFLSVVDSAITALVLRTGEMVSPDLKPYLESLAASEEVYEYVAGQLPLPRSTSLVRSIAQESEAARHLLYAEELFYRNRELLHVEIAVSSDPPPDMLLALCMEQTQKRSRTVDINEQRRIFGPSAVELELEGIHLDMVVRCGRGADNAFNAAVAALLELPAKKNQPTGAANPQASQRSTRAQPMMQSEAGAACCGRGASKRPCRDS